MKNISFYLIMNKLYVMSFNRYINYIKEQILNTKWFKEACKEKKITVKYLSKHYFKNILSNGYFKYKNAKYYFYKLLLIKFEYKENLENNNHIKLLNVNIVNETRFKIVKLLISLQKSFLDTNYFFNMKIIDREDFIDIYIKRYDSYLDKSILSKVLNNTYFLFNKSIYKLIYLVPKKRFIYSIYIKDIINTNSDSLTGDEQISNLLYQKYCIKLSRRVICSIRNNYLIPKIRITQKFNEEIQFIESFSNKKVLNKQNISLLPNNLKGVYELSSNKIETYPYLTNRVIYIGSSKNIKKKLNTYLSAYAHTEEIKNFIQKSGKDIYFRYTKSLEYRDFESKIINHFIYLHWELPKLNTQRVFSSYIL
ncbi:GIY-YIG nuclease family protein [Aliarcobacter cryaerophilus]|uniref:GIY-YIG nuclease family protein n=1 Tax=Aliarcobacter cryaerophilus TaxID=28198 RepID=UPI0011DF2729|nr:GIY-YIG nuclease family protein [Aliarcobacter cryaerophilus]